MPLPPFYLYLNCMTLFEKTAKLHYLEAGGEMVSYDIEISDEVELTKMGQKCLEMQLEPASEEIATSK